MHYKKKAEIATKMGFAKQLFLLFLVNQEKLLAVLAKCLKNYLDFKLLHLLHFRFLRARIFQNTSFSLSFMVAALGITRQLTRWEPVVLLILSTFLGCLSLPESSNFVHDAYGIKQIPRPNALRGLFQAWDLKFMLVFKSILKLLW